MSTRRTIRRTAAALAAFGLAGGLATDVAAAAPAEKVWVCHGTASATNPYVAVNVSGNAADPNKGHLYGDPGHGWKNNPDQELVSPPGKAGPLEGADCGSPNT